MDRLDVFESNVWDVASQRQTLSPQLFDALDQARTEGKVLTKQQRNAIADALLNFALDRGASSYLHWFAPMRDGSAGKIDSFLGKNFSTNELELEFSGGSLFFNETDGSSFPNGGLRSTHRAAAYMSWDMTSSPFVRGRTLYIPAILVSYKGEPLDNKLVLLRSQDAVDREATRLLRAMGDNESSHVVCNVGWEQEFFIVPLKEALSRPDIISAGRTLFGALSHRNQQMEQNYFGRVPSAVEAVLRDMQTELWSYGVSVNVLHNEVAPSQHEMSPIFTITSESTDWNALAMEVLAETAIRHGYVALLHEKPFAGINGSGKHLNWGLNTDSGSNIYTPGKTVAEQRRFITFVAALIRAAHIHGDLIRVGVACPGNDYRLGAQEAPPAIISLYTGDKMEEHLRSVIEGGKLEGYGTDKGSVINTGSSAVQPVPAATEDRNRTAPFPFCGNRFEIRACGSSVNTALPLAIVNTVVAESVAYIADKVEAGGNLRDVVAEVLREHIPVVFNGNGYSEAWEKDAAKRGLNNFRTMPDAVERLVADQSIEVFGKMKVLSKEGVEARREILHHQYAETCKLEASTLLDMINTGIVPSVRRELEDRSELADIMPEAVKSRDRVQVQLAALLNQEVELRDALAKCPDEDEKADAHAVAVYARDEIRARADKIRVPIDALEREVRKEYWTFPTYDELLLLHHYLPPTANVEDVETAVHGSGRLTDRRARTAVNGGPSSLVGDSSALAQKLSHVQADLKMPSSGKLAGDDASSTSSAGRRGGGNKRRGKKGGARK